MAEPVLVAWSGGKDSALALQEVLRDERYRVVALVTTVTAEYERISMHGVRRGLLHQQAQAPGLPLEEVLISPRASNEEYEGKMEAALAAARARFPGLDAVVFGDLFLADIRAYRERMLARIGMRGLFPLWLRDTRVLAADFVRPGYKAVLACVDSRALPQTSSAGQVIGVVNAADNTVSFVSATDFSVRTVGLATPGGAATTAAGRGGTVIVPLGPADSVAVIHNAGLCTTGLCVRPVVVFALPRGSGATGAAIRDDSIAWVANPNLNTVTRLNFLTGDTASFRVGAYPRAMALVGGRVFVASGNLVSGAPAGASWLNAYACCGVSTLDSIPLSATNARFLAVGDDSL